MAKRDIYQEVTDRIIAEMEQGVLRWVKPWSRDKAGLASGFPVNAISRRPYSGVNVLQLWGTEQANQTWMTFKQAKEKGGQVRRGEKGTEVFYASSYVPKDQREEARKAAARGEILIVRPIHFLKSYHVFNVSQIDGLPDDMTGGGPELTEPEKIEEGERIARDSGAEIRHGGAIHARSDAFYSTAGDYVHMPPHVAFNDPVNYYPVLFHELTHWTGAESRLDREIVNGFGSEKYAFEELVAELGGAFVCARVQIQPIVRHSDYIGNWLKVLKEDKRAIFRAASLASKAAGYLVDGPESVQKQDAA